MKTIGFIGAGTVGTALAWSLTKAAANDAGQPWRVAAVASRRRSSAELFAAAIPGCQAYDSSQQVADRADLVFVTTPDDVIQAVAEEVAWRAGQCVVHCSGAASIAVLEPARRLGAVTGGFHPLLPFAGVERAMDDLPGVTFALEGEEPLLSTLQAMAQGLGGRWILLRPEDKVLYHIAGVLVSNYVVTLTKLATDLWKRFGVDRETAVAALVPLLQGAVNNLSEAGLPDALTGPMARGDSGTIRRHLAALAAQAPELLDAYRELGLQTLPVAVEKGKLAASQASELRLLLQQAGPDVGNEKSRRAAGAHL